MSAKAAALLGVCIVLAAIILAGAHKDNAGPRYQMVADGHGGLVLLNTETGQSWRKFIPQNGGPVEWERCANPK